MVNMNYADRLLHRDQ